MNTTKVTNLYIKLIEAMNITIEEDTLMIGDEPFKISKLPAKLPTENTIKNIMINGKIQYSIFNPLDDNVLTGTNEEITKLLKMYSTVLNYTLKKVVVGILASVGDKNSQYPLFITELLSMLSVAKGNAKVLIDDSVIKSFDSIANDETLFAFKLTMKHGMVVEGDKENSTILLKSPILRLIEDDDWIDSNFKRKKDARIANVIYPWIHDYLVGDNDVITTSSNDDAADFVSFYKALIKISDKMKKLAKYISDSGFYYPMLENDLEMGDLNDIYSIVNDAKLIPSINTNSNSVIQMDVSNNTQVISLPDDDDDDSDVIDTPEKLFGKGYVSNNQMQQPQMMQPNMQQPQMMQPQMMQPNMMQQPNIMQPMVQQPNMQMMQQMGQPGLNQMVQPPQMLYANAGYAPVQQQPTQQQPDNIFNALKGYR